MITNAILDYGNGKVQYVYTEWIEYEGGTVGVKLGGEHGPSLLVYKKYLKALPIQKGRTKDIFVKGPEHGMEASR